MRRWRSVRCSVATTERTYPCVMRNGHIRELTAAQLRAEEWARMPCEAKIVALLERVETLEADVRRLQEAANG